MITVALPKGRTLEATLQRFARAGLAPEEDLARTRKLIVPARGGAARLWAAAQVGFDCARAGREHQGCGSNYSIACGRA